jgi:hypothetical protein
VGNTVEWFFGRGLSIECGLNWTVPNDWRALERDDQISRIKKALLAEMSASHINTNSIRRVLTLLANHTISPWRHQFYTTNWDFLLQKEILDLSLRKLPSWCAESHVYHLNGTIEILPDNSKRSTFVLESDFAAARAVSIEGNIAYNKFIWSQIFVVVGMSFECEVDKYLLSALNRVEDDLPIGESYWIVLNPDINALSASCERLRLALPRSKVIGNAKTFSAWLDMGMPELQSREVVALQ